MTKGLCASNKPLCATLFACINICHPAELNTRKILFYAKSRFNTSLLSVVVTDYKILYWQYKVLHMAVRRSSYSIFLP